MNVRILFFLIVVLTASRSLAQLEVPRFKKYDIGRTDCKVYLPADPVEFEMEHSEDGSEVYTGEVVTGEFHFAVILARFESPIGESPEDKNDMITAYLDFLQVQFSVTGAAGYGFGHGKDNVPDAVGVIDYWEDEEGMQYAVKAWCNQEFLAVLMLYGKEEYPYQNAREIFLDGFRFPGE